MTARALGIGSTILMLAGPAFAHHSFAMFDYNKDLTIVGDVKELQWTNPHIHLVVNVPDGKASVTEWDIEGGTPGTLRRTGWTRDILKAGDKVSVKIHPMKDGTHGGMLVLASHDGKPIGAAQTQTP